MNWLFVYGTLMIPELCKLLLGKDTKKKSAILNDYKTACINYRDAISEYPVLISEKSNKVFGEIIGPLTDYDFELLSFYEGNEYFLSEIMVETDEGKQTVKVYLPHSSKLQIIEKPWEINSFRKNHLQKYLTEVIPETLKLFFGNTD